MGIGLDVFFILSWGFINIVNIYTDDCKIWELLLTLRIVPRVILLLVPNVIAKWIV